MLNLKTGQLEIVREILRRLAPSAAVLAFGSRVSNPPPKEFSDLDLAVISSGGLSLKEIAALREAFSDSDLPFEVDIVDWRDTGENFREIILSRYEIIQGKFP